MDAKKLSEKLKKIEKKMSYAERVDINITLMVLGDLGSARFYRKSDAATEVLDMLVEENIIRRMSVEQQKEAGWYESTSPETGDLLARAALTQGEGYLVFPEK